MTLWNAKNLKSRLRKEESEQIRVPGEASYAFIDVNIARSGTAQWKPPIPAMLDTGSGEPLTLNSRLFDLLGGKTVGRQTVILANNEQVEVGVGKVDLRIMGISLLNVPCSIFDGPEEKDDQILLGGPLLDLFIFLRVKGESYLKPNVAAMQEVLTPWKPNKKMLIDRTKPVLRWITEDESSSEGLQSRVSSLRELPAIRQGGNYSLEHR